MSQRFRMGRVVALSLLLLLTACKVELFGGLSEGEANDVVGALLQAGISAAKAPGKEGTSSVTVEENDFARAVAVLKQLGLPRRQFQTIGDVFQQGGLVSSPTQERARFLWALGQELSSTVSQIDGVLTARVQVVLPDNDMMRREPSPSSASVFIRHTPQSQAPRLVPQIKSLVANSVEGLTYDKVSVVLVQVDPQDLPASVPVEQSSRLIPLGVTLAILAVLGGLLFTFRQKIMAAVRRVAPSPGE